MLESLKMMHKIKNLVRIFISYFYSLLYGFPQKKLKIIGVTGTDGKTTTSNFIYNLLSTEGLKVGLVSTINAKFGDKQIDTGFHVTSPNPQDVIKILKKMVDSNIEYAVLEVTSHALAQNRFASINFDYGVFTNISSEHLDYHKDFDSYLLTKAKLIDKSNIVVLDSDDQKNFEKLSNYSKERKKIVAQYGKDSFVDKKLLISIKESLIKNFPGEYNIENALAALSVYSLVTSKSFSEDLAFRFEGMQGLPGRFEQIPNNLGINIIVDFAHTTNSLKQVLTLVNEQKQQSSKVILVFGCAGLRDQTKRTPMGQVAGSLADLVIVTAEDPRTENLDKINEKIVEGIKKSNGTYIIEKDRKNAILKAIENAEKGDFVVITGKGHEKSMCFGIKEYPWSDQDAVKEILKVMHLRGA